MDSLRTADPDERFMHAALAEARAAFDDGEVPVGAVVVWNGKIVGRGHNAVERLSDPTAHAEMIAMTAAFNKLGAKYLTDATLYVTVEPCLMCTGGMYWSKLGAIVWGAPDVKNGHRRFLGPGAPSPFHPKAIVREGVLAAECAILMKEFFVQRR